MSDSLERQGIEDDATYWMRRALAGDAEVEQLRVDNDECMNAAHHANDSAAIANADNSRLRTEVERLTKALEFYANPDTYFAIAFFPDPPCGDFNEDGSFVDEYGRMMPGALARRVLGWET